ncbi:MAG: hypothetical protein V3V31_07170 [Methylococcales bacterium]
MVEQTTHDGINNDGDILELLDVLAMVVGVNPNCRMSYISNQKQLCEQA